MLSIPRRSSSTFIKPLPARTWTRASVISSQSASSCSLRSIGASVCHPPRSCTARSTRRSYRAERAARGPPRSSIRHDPAVPAFRGFPPEALEFLRELEANNDRDWFKANRARYDAHLLEPARELAETLTDLGQPHFFRPYNDTRFHARPPIKEQLGVAVGYGGAGGYYVELSLDGLLVAAGLHQPAGDQLDRYRRAIDDGRRAAGFERAVKAAEAAGLGVPDPELKRAPRGYPPDHPPIDRLR